jgi:hypothetical protein
MMDSTASPKVKIVGREGIQVRSLTHNISGVEGCVRALGWTNMSNKQFNYSHEPTQTKQQVG